MKSTLKALFFLSVAGLAYSLSKTKENAKELIIKLAAVRDFKVDLQRSSLKVDLSFLNPTNSSYRVELKNVRLVNSAGKVLAYNTPTLREFTIPANNEYKLENLKIEISVIDVLTSKLTDFTLEVTAAINGMDLPKQRIPLKQ